MTFRNQLLILLYLATTILVVMDKVLTTGFNVHPFAVIGIIASGIAFVGNLVLNHMNKKHCCESK